MFQLPTTLLLFLLPLVDAQTSTPPPTRTTAAFGPLPTPTQSLVLNHLIPPYGPGAANFYASVIRYAPGDGTYFAITCYPATTTSGVDLFFSDPCNTSAFGTISQEIFQNSETWKAVRKGTVTEGGITRWLHRDSTICSWGTPSTTQANNPTVIPRLEDVVCKANTSRSPSFALVAETGNAVSQFGLRIRPVTVTAGFGDLAEKTQLVTSAPFTDIGASNTRAPPKTTVTLFVMPGVGSSLKVGWAGLVFSLMNCFWVLMLP
ncbi:hypothetical protein B0J11DRAFT_231260 [Dendryphion nanum]|uniref:Uncharacterized protein n=1 Tax=Dendryphion nanum TaxID=256645 RepID=A0A9P9E8G8_9PLEO|nr:hypothetical protein B0J11DRAFT_231260 [Dendryphion nanum]